MHSVLAARSEFSLGESILQIKKLVKASKEAGATAVALVDTMSVTGLIDFTNQCKAEGIKPIIGCRLRLVDDPAWRKTKEDKKTPKSYYINWYCLSEKGLQGLFRLLTLANSDERFYFEAKLSFGDVTNELREEIFTEKDVAITTGDEGSILEHPNAEKMIEGLNIILGGDGVFCALNPIDAPYWDRLNAEAIRVARKLNLETLVTRPALYLNKEGEADAADVMNAVYEGNKLAEVFARSPVYRDAHPVTLPNLVRASAAAAQRLTDRYGVEGAGRWFNMGIKNTTLLVDDVTYTWAKAPVSLPKMADDEFATLQKAAMAGFKARLTTEAFGHKPTPEELRDVYVPRLKYELEVLKKLGFAGYFLLVMDIVNYAKTNGILVGPGRGSVGGSLVAYLTGITDCDPIRFGLLFERFINPDRIDLPDADLDFMSERRHEVIDYLIKKFGEDRVAGISNYADLAAASAIRDVGKAFGLAEDDCRCSKYVPKKHGANVPLPDCAEQVPEIAAFRDKNKPLWDVMVRLEGTMKNYGRHAAGVVVGGCPLVERAVIERRKDGATINWDKRIVEDQGLVKVDILGLSTLDLIKKTLDYIWKRHTTRVDLNTIPLDDPKVLENFATAKTTGIFQFESGGMRRLLKELGKFGSITFEDITAATALYRPGPMESGMMDSYWKRKQGDEDVEYDHALMEPILKPTFGVMVYQEQVMQVARTIAGYSAPDADKLRKIMGKKLPEEMKKERGKFVDGCVKTVGCTEEWAGNLFDKIEGFAGYGFNKSHSVEYTLISYQSMWLKTYYPVEFFAAGLSMGKDNVPTLLKDARTSGIEIVMPDINLSTEQFEILTDTKLCIPFNAIKGLSENGAKAILAARAAGPFKDKADFIARVERRKVHAGIQEKLDKVGVFARIEPTQPPANDESRIKDQIELVPGLVLQSVPIYRELKRDRDTKIKVVELVNKYRDERKDDGVQVAPLLGKDASFMVITDGPTGGEERSGRFTETDGFANVMVALEEAGLQRSDGYWTGLLKRPKEGKQPSAKEIETYLPYLKQEIELMRPPAIVLLGSTVVRTFLPDFKGKASDAAGKVIYSKELEANLIVGFAPGEIFYDPDKQLNLNEVFRVAAELTN